MKRIVPDGDLVAVGMYINLEAMIEQNIDPSRVRVMYGWVHFTTRKGMLKHLPQTYRFKIEKPHLLPKVLALSTYLWDRNCVRVVDIHGCPGVIASHSGFLPYEKYRELIERHEADHGVLTTGR